MALRNTEDNSESRGLSHGPGVRSGDHRTRSSGELRLSKHQLAAVDAVLETSSWAIEHVHQVRQIAAWLFDDLREFHGLGAPERTLLEAAAVLHDIGYPIDPSDHHKISARIIRTMLADPFTTDQIQIIALLARYHRKGVPQLRHRRYGQLDERGRRLIVWLGGILRVADGLDRAHDSSIRWLSTSVVDGRLEIQASVGQPTAHRASVDEGDDPDVAAVNVAGANRKRDLLERALGMPVVVRLV